MVHAGDVCHVRGEGDPVGRRVAHQSEPAGDYRAQAVGTYDNATRVRFPFPVSRPPDDACDGAPLGDHILDRDAFANLRARPGRGGDEDRIERRARHREAVGSGRAAEAADHRGPARRDDFHAVQLGVRGALD